VIDIDAEFLYQRAIVSIVYGPNLFFLEKAWKQVPFLRGMTWLHFGQCVLLMCNLFCGILIKLRLLLGCSKTADMIVSKIKQHFW